MQAATRILMVRPASFGFNAETAASNTFQHTINEPLAIVQQRARKEFDAFTETLSAKGVEVIVIDDTPQPVKPDALFPNNWISFHADGTIVLYPMHAPNRRTERRKAITDELCSRFAVKQVIDLSHHEVEGRCLEGTGSIVFDHVHRIAYACLSPRTDEGLFTALCKQLGYAPLSFIANDRGGKAIYHTNVMMCLGEGFAVICLESITDPKQRELVNGTLLRTGHQVFAISFAQMGSFAGNMLAVRSSRGDSLLVLSQSAFNSLSGPQRAGLAKHAELVPVRIPTIETVGGGSARCMMAEIFLPEER